MKKRRIACSAAQLLLVAVVMLLLVISLAGCSKKQKHNPRKKSSSVETTTSSLPTTSSPTTSTPSDGAGVTNTGSTSNSDSNNVSSGSSVQTPKPPSAQTGSSTKNRALANLRATLPYEYCKFYNGGANLHWFVIDYGSSPDKPGKKAILITGKADVDDPAAEEKYARDFTASYLHKFGCDPSDFEIIYTYEPMNNL